MTPDTAPRAPEHSLALRILMLAGGALASLALIAVNSVLPAIDAALAHGPRDSMLVKQMLGAVGLAMVVGAPLGGFLVDRLGLRPLVVGCALVYTLAGTAGLYLSSLPLLVASRLVIGVASGMLQVISLTTINTRLAGTQRARWMGYHISVAMVGTLALHPLAGLLGDHGWRWPFALYFAGLVMVPVGLLQERRAPCRAAIAGPAVEADPVVRSLLAAFPYHYVPFALAIGTIVFAPTVYLPFILRERGFGSPLLISLVLTADSVAGTIMAMLYGRARQRLSGHDCFAVSFTFTTLGLAIAIFAPFTWLFIVGIMVYGVGVGWLIANLITSLSEKLAEAQQGRATGFVKAAHFASAPLAILILEPLVRAHGPMTALAISGGLSAGLLVLIAVRRGWSPTRLRTAPADRRTVHG